MHVKDEMSFPWGPVYFCCLCIVTLFRIKSGRHFFVVHPFIRRALELAHFPEHFLLAA
jgi:hypothetical protein